MVVICMVYTERIETASFTFFLLLLFAFVCIVVFHLLISDSIFFLNGLKYFKVSYLLKIKTSENVL